MKGSTKSGRFRTATDGLWRRAGDGLLAGLVFAAALALYARTLAPSVVALFDDSLEFPLVAYRLAIAHPTGYPLYTLLGHVFILGARENPAWAVNLLSAVCGALTVTLVYVGIRLLAGRRLPALAGALALAVSPVFWSQSVIAEVYTLNSAVVAGLLWLALAWARHPLLPLPVPPSGQAPISGRRQAGLFLPSERARRPVLPALRQAAAASVARVRRPRRVGGLFLPAARRGGVRRSALRQMLSRPRPAQLGLFLPGERLPAARRAGRRLVAAGRGTYRALSAAARRAYRLLSAAARRLSAAAAAAARALSRAGSAAARRLHRTYRRFYPEVPADRRLCPHPLLFAMAGLLGLGLAHHRTVLLLVPALLLFVLLVERRVLTRAALLGPAHPQRPRWRQVTGRPGFLLAVCALAPLLLYLYLPLRGHVGSLDGTYTNSLAGAWQWVTGSSYGAFLADNPLARDLDTAAYLTLFWQQFGPVGLALALMGLWALIGNPRALVLTGLAFAATVGFALGYHVPDVEVFFIPAFVIAAIWIGVGLAKAGRLLRPRGPSIAARRIVAACRVLLFGAALVQPLAIATRGYPELDLSRCWAAHDYGRYALAQPLPPDSTVVGLLGETTLLRYFQETQGLRPDIETVAADAEPERRAAVATALKSGRNVYVTRPLPGLESEHALSAVTGLMGVPGDVEALVGVGAPSYDVPPAPQPADVRVMRGLRLVGYGVGEHRAHWQAWVRLRLWWRAPNGLAERLKVSARLLTPEGRLVAAVDAEPVANTYPTTAWRPREVVADAYEIPLPAGTPPGRYTLLVVVYDAASGQERGRAELGPVTLEGNPERPPRCALEAGIGRTVYALFGEVTLLGFSAPAGGPFRAGDALPVTLLWQAGKKPVADELRLELWLEGEGVYLLGEMAVGGPFAASQWHPRQVVRQWPVLRVPEDAAPGGYHLKLRVLRNGRPLPWGRWLIPLGSDLNLGPVSVSE